MVNIVREFEVPCPQTAAVDYLADFANAVEWDPGTVKCERTGDAGAPVQVGSTWRNTSKILGRETELTYELIEQRPDGVVLEGENDTAHSRDDIRVEAIDEHRSRVRYEATITFKGLARVVDPLMSLVFTKVAADLVRDMTKALTGVGRRA